ncbi:Phage or plasmid primase P4-like protein [Novosphingobium aromaticivorans DSM 12444]|uniref:Phage or plasmid primase P4-like protein n=1 Tax=Novosphingobium aromaticivorans (strain ATCC 700278 / DSM 12444 / CCUG 56034 / CIP 105152 / NBRC 16084 / F199) TaxID=279238 RepID=Q2GAN4_NOVAD|nr:DNA primase family protein [Novosphingobium aromaticivorans]ABD25089.1 Phage or plasmid primase P4-like protein [Novosphingobium aromaticivorans DSM 12444]SCY95980.1 phage/plasmid primase, P4 family, C-terminal domain-containing protein [Novosphingobium aromaticivorans]
MKRLSLLERSRLPTNDLGNARRLFEAANGRLLWLADGAGGKGCWIAFDGIRWSADEGPMRALAFAQKAAVEICDEAHALRECTADELAEVYGRKFSKEMAEERAGQLWTWSIKSGDSAKTTAMQNQFKGLRDGDEGPFVTQVWQRDFDAQPMAYHCSNGTLRFVQDDAGTWSHVFEKGHRPDDRFMQVANVAYDAAAKAKAWIERMEVMHHDPVQRTALQRIYGMTLTALISDQAFYIFQGKGQDGKSVTNDVVCQLHGMYARKADPKTFLEGPTQQSSGPQSDIVRLAGDVRLVVMDEPKKNSTWDGQKIKQATGSEMIARGVHATTELSFTPHWQLIAECNGLPKAPSDDRGFRRRFKLYPWVVQFGVTPGVADEPVHLVKARLIGEGSGVLNWMIKGCVEWLNERVVPEPEAAKRATASFWSASSAMGEWIASHCDLSDPEAREEATPLYKAFRQFCIDRGDDETKIITQTTFGRQLNDAQIYRVPNNSTGKVERVGIRLKRVDELGGGALSTSGRDTFDDDVARFDADNRDPFGAP